MGHCWFLREEFLAGGGGDLAVTGASPQPDDQVGPLSLQDGQGSMQGRAPVEEPPPLPAGDRCD